MQVNSCQLTVASWNTHCTEDDSKAGPGSAGRSDLRKWREEKVVAPFLGTPHNYDKEYFSSGKITKSILKGYRNPRLQAKSS